MRCSEPLRLSRRVLSASGAPLTFGASGVRSTVWHAPRQPPRSLSLGSLGATSRVSFERSPEEDIPSSMPLTNLHALKIRYSEPIARVTVWPSVASSRSCVRRFQRLPGGRRQRVRRLHCSESIAIRTLPAISPAAAPSVSTVRRLLAFLSSVRVTDSSIPDIHVRASIASHTVNRTLSQRPQRVQVTPNHALQRTAPRVTARAFCERSAIYICASSVRSTLGHAPRHAPPSLSLRSLERVMHFDGRWN